MYHVNPEEYRAMMSERGDGGLGHYDYPVEALTKAETVSEDVTKEQRQREQEALEQSAQRPLSGDAARLVTRSSQETPQYIPNPSTLAVHQSFNWGM